jgi:hypothetical protein
MCSTFVRGGVNRQTTDALRVVDGAMPVLGEAARTHKPTADDVDLGGDFLMRSSVVSSRAAPEMASRSSRSPAVSIGIYRGEWSRTPTSE